MSKPHQIRLHGPWQLYLETPANDPVASSTLKACGRFTAPSGLTDQLPAAYAGKALLQRSFHRPTGLDSHSRVQLRILSNVAGRLSLNERPLESLTAGEQVFDVTDSLRTRNQIQIELVIDASSRIGQPSCDVRLEILELC